MAQFKDWCDSLDGKVGNHHRRVMTGKTAMLDAGIEATAAVVPGHYVYPPATAEDMYRPERYGRTAFGEVEVKAR